MHNIYLDHNATTNINPIVLEEMSKYSHLPLNPSSVHKYGREARRLVEEAKRRICEYLNIDYHAYHIIFTSSGTEANNWVFKGLSGYKQISSKIEHASVLKALDDNAILIGVDKNGMISTNELEQELEKQKDNKVIISIMYANNEIGVIQNLYEISALAKEYGALLHSDMVQAVGKTNVDFEELDLDLFTISSHKIGGPQGVAALFIRKNIDIKPLIVGGGQNQGLRAGTENVLGIIGMSHAIKYAQENLNDYIEYCGSLRDDMEARLKSICKDVKFIGESANRLANTSAIYMPGFSSETQIISFDMEGICISAGSACSSGRIASSHVILAAGYPEEEARNIIRFSMSRNNTKDDIEKFIDTWRNIYNLTRE